jgi:DNA-binding transcriptional ArsR family regulator
MDDKKDSSLTSLREVKDLSSFSILIDSLFKDIDDQDKGRVKILKKVIRIAEALYLVSDSISVTESLRTDIRSQGLRLVDLSFSYAFEGDIVRITECLHVLAKLGWLVHIAHVSNFISRVSAELLHTALSDVRSKLVGVGGTLPLDYFEQSAEVDFVPHSVTSREDRVRRQQKTSYEKAGAPKNTERRDAILSLLRKQSKVNVKDVLGVVAGVSEKTIQRELLALVDEGILKKEGERRWTLYSLK